ncbi:hypothetical protein Efla_007629 [Eimeria flavescens]
MQLQKAAEHVYKSMCRFVDYAIAALELKDSNVCLLMTKPPLPLIQTLSDMLAAHVTRVQLGRFSATIRPLSTLTLHDIVHADSLPKHPGSALTVGVLRFVEAYFSKGISSEKTGEGPPAFQKVKRGLSGIYNLVADKLYKLKPKIAEWNEKVIRSLRLLVNYVVRLVLSSAKEMTKFGKKTLAMQQAEQATQISMRRRVQQGGKAGIPQYKSDAGSTAGQSRSSFVEEEDEQEAGDASPKAQSRAFSEREWNSVALVQTRLLTKPDPKHGQGTLGLVRLLASMLLSDLPRLVSDITAHILPTVWGSISGVLRVKKTIVGSVKDTAEKVCVRVLDSTVLPSLISTNSLVPAGLIKTQMTLLARNIHFSVSAEASTVESYLKAARQERGFLGMSVLIRGLVLVVAGQLQDLLQDAKFQERVVKIIHKRVRELSSVIQTAFKRYLVSEVVCQIVEVVIDVIADALSEKRDDFVQSVLEVVESDALGHLSIFIESSAWRFMKLLLDGEGASDLMRDILGQVGLLGFDLLLTVKILHHV